MKKALGKKIEKREERYRKICKEKLPVCDRKNLKR